MHTLKSPRIEHIITETDTHRLIDNWTGAKSPWCAPGNICHLAVADGVTGKEILIAAVTDRYNAMLPSVFTVTEVDQGFSATDNNFSVSAVYRRRQAHRCFNGQIT